MGISFNNLERVHLYREKGTSGLEGILVMTDAELAKEIGPIDPQTINLKDAKRVADRLGIGLNKLFELVTMDVKPEEKPAPQRSRVLFY